MKVTNTEFSPRKDPQSFVWVMSWCNGEKTGCIIIMNNLAWLSLENRNHSWRYFISQDLLTSTTTDIAPTPSLTTTCLMSSHRNIHEIEVSWTIILNFWSNHTCQIILLQVMIIEILFLSWSSLAFLFLFWICKCVVRYKMLVFYVKTPLTVMAAQLCCYILSGCNTLE